MSPVYKMSNAGNFLTRNSYKNMLAGNSQYSLPVGNYENIATVNFGGTATATAFTRIPNTFRHLQIRGVFYSTSTGLSRINFNSDFGANYNGQWLYSDGSTVSGGRVSSQPNAAGFGYINSNDIGYGEAFIVTILDYADPTKHKAITVFEGRDTNGVGGHTEIQSGIWFNTSPITAITLTCASSGNFGQYSKFSLYGIRG